MSEANASVLWRVMQRAHLRRFQDVPRLARDEFVRRVAARPGWFDGRLPGRFEWLIAVRGNAPIGWVSLRIGENTRGAAEVGYSIVLEARGKGYAAEAARAMVAEAFRIGLRQVDACCVPANSASRRLLASVGFTQTRLQRNGAVVRGRPVDICIYRLTCDEWYELQGSSTNSIVMPASSNP